MQSPIITSNPDRREQPAAGRPLAGRVAVVTGGSGGLGTAICHMLADAGASVIAADVRHDRAADVVRAVRGAGGEATALALDVADEASVTRAVAEVAARHGRLDILINNAGVDVTAPIEELSVADWDAIVGVNLRGPFLLCKQAFPIMKNNGGGHIVNITSTAAVRAWPNATAYHASKWGLLGFSHALHTEGRPHNIKVTAVINGGMRTPFILDRFPETPLENLQDPRNVAETVRFVLSQPAETVIPEVMVLPMRETSWP
jgi:NAD(P)-dependent dehydrogenase (short-subunit alcohol dehydrogenase family)